MLSLCHTEAALFTYPDVRNQSHLATRIDPSQLIIRLTDDTAITTQYAQKALTSEYREVSRRSAIEGASPHKLTQLLIEGALKQINLAQLAIDNTDIQSRGNSINKATAIISELRRTLDMEKGGEIAENLNNLYAYMENVLFNAHLNNDRDALSTTADLLSDLLSAWKAIK